MIYKRLGKTGLETSLLGLGTLYWTGGIDTRMVSGFLDKAKEAGINNIDTARVYGDSEANIGPALKGRREDFILSTKGISRNLESFKRDFETSMNNLRTDYLDIFYIHSVGSKEEFDSVMRDGVYEYAAAQKEKGRIRHLAVSSHDIGTAKLLVGSGLFEVLMVSYNPADRSPEEELIPLCATEGVGVVVMKPVGGGVLAKENSDKYNITITAAESIKFCMANPGVSTVIPGIRTLAHLEGNLAVLKDFEDNGYTREELDKAIAGVSGLGSDFCRGCGYCKPCPQGIDIPDLMGLYSRFRVYEHRNWQQMESIRAEYMGKETKADICAECGSCMERCPYKLPIVETMGKVSSWR